MITDAIRLEAKKLLALGFTRKQIAKKLGFCASTMFLVLSGKEKELREKKDPYQKEYQRRIRATRKENAKRLKTQMGGECYQCGYKRFLPAIDFHHKDPAQKETNVSRIGDYSLMEIEAAKCVLLCANCHRELHGGFITLRV